MGGINGTHVLTAATLTDDGAVDPLEGEGDVDWFFILNGASPDLLCDLAGDDFVTTL